MPQKSSQPAPKGAPKEPPKRRASARLSTSDVKRIKSNSAVSGPMRSTSQRSKYFESESSAEPGVHSDSGDSASAYGQSSTDQDSDSEPEPQASSEEPEEQKTTSSSRQSGANTGIGKPMSAANPLKGEEAWREGVRTGLEPGVEVFIEKPKAREAGNVTYQDKTLHPNTKLFLLDLADNNEREWLKAHDPDFRAAKKDFETFIDTLTPEVIRKDDTIPELPSKDLIFRIHRDVRFSKNPVPYKIHFSAAWSRTGKKGPYAAYYVHFQPGSCFVGGFLVQRPSFNINYVPHSPNSCPLAHLSTLCIGCGLWNPEADALAALREDIDENSDQWKEILGAEDMRREILGGVADDQKKVVKAFAHQNRNSALKTKPKGYEIDNKNIELLRLRSFTLGCNLPDEEIMEKGAQDRIATLIEIMEPFVTYLNSVVMPDP
ncbi:hypothetical protein N7495_007490 [Penicillium taxi]|uniref:uncharacterized protein n=1 Tax=Penicillium taxi TaxID=168475 RepID=UPI00254572F5|nr:uncharacterized protein N7495_007490 [Penicillium taxi]KAJ5887449.1 hypothetical protein N7495_007490 [Penicillium taxi]